MTSAKHIAFFAEMSKSTTRVLLQGIYKYVTSMAPTTIWTFKQVEPEPTSLRALQRWGPDGIIADLRAPGIVRKLTALGKPIVNISPTLPVDVPRVIVDNRAIGCLGADYLIGQGFTNFGFFSDATGVHVEDRKTGFMRTLGQRGYQCSVLDPGVCPLLERAGADPEQQDQAVRQWLLSLPNPVGVLATNDWRALRLSDLCRTTHLHVPENVALIGVDNDELICNLGHPPLSSVALPTEKMGYEAAKLLDKLMSGKRPPKHPIVFPPLRVIVRQSSDTLAIADREIAQVLRFIRQNAAKSINVQSILQAFPIARRSLEQRFRTVLGHTPLEEIRRIQIERATQLLVETDLSMPDVAKASGLGSSAQLSHVFRRELQARPTEIRKRSRIC